MTFTRSSKDGVFTVDLTIQDGVEEFSEESIQGLIDIMQHTIDTFKVILEGDEDVAKAMMVKGES